MIAIYGYVESADNAVPTINMLLVLPMFKWFLDLQWVNEAMFPRDGNGNGLGVVIG